MHLCSWGLSLRSRSPANIAHRPSQFLFGHFRPVFLGLVAVPPLWQSLRNPYLFPDSAFTCYPYKGFLENLQKVFRISLISIPSKCYIPIAFIKGFEGSARKCTNSQWKSLLLGPWNPCQIHGPREDFLLIPNLMKVF